LNYHNLNLMELSNIAVCSFLRKGSITKNMRLLNCERFIMKYMRLVLISSFFSLHILGMDDHVVVGAQPMVEPDVQRHEQRAVIVPITQRVQTVFATIQTAKDAQRDFCTQRSEQKKLFDGLQEISRERNQQKLLSASTIEAPSSKQFLIGHEELRKCSREIVPILCHIKGEIDQYYALERLSSIQHAEDRQGMRIGESFFETLIRRLEGLNERLEAPIVAEDDDNELVQSRMKLLVARSRRDLLIIQKDLIKFFKILAGKPCDIGESEPWDFLVMAQHGAQKFDLESVPQISEWAHKLCKWYNILFKKDGEAPLQLPECFRRVQKPRPRTPEPVPASDGSEREDGRAQEPQTEDLQSPQSSVLKNAAAIEEFKGDGIIGFGGTNRHLRAFEAYRKGEAGVVNGVLNRAQEKAGKIFEPAQGSGWFKRFASYIVGGVCNRVARCARWVAYKTFLTKEDFERKPWEKRSTGTFWDQVLRGYPDYQEPQTAAQPQRRWWHRLMFWKR